MPSPVVPSLWKIFRTLCRAVADPPSLSTISRIVQFSEARTVSPAQRMPSSSISTRMMSSLATPRTNHGVLSSRTVPSPRSMAHRLSTLAGGQPSSSMSIRKWTFTWSSLMFVTAPSSTPHGAGERRVLEQQQGNGDAGQLVGTPWAARVLSVASVRMPRSTS